MGFAHFAAAALAAIGRPEGLVIVMLGRNDGESRSWNHTSKLCMSNDGRVIYRKTLTYLDPGCPTFFGMYLRKLWDRNPKVESRVQVYIPKFKPRVFVCSTCAIG